MTGSGEGSGEGEGVGLGDGDGKMAQLERALMTESVLGRQHCSWEQLISSKYPTPVMRPTVMQKTSARTPYLVFILTILLITGLVYAITARAQPQPDLLETGRIDTGGNAFYVQVSDNICVVSEVSYNGLKFYNVTDPTSIMLLGTYKHGSGAPHNTIIHENVVFLADMEDGVEIIDITDPSSPSFISSTQTGGYAWDLQLYKNLLYVVDYNEGLKIFDISDDGNLIEIGYFNSSSFSSIHITENDLAFITAYKGELQILNISDPTKPVPVGFYDELKAPTRVIVRDNIAHISDWDNGYISLDVSDPENPREFAHYNDGGTCVALHIDNNLAYISEWYNGLEILNISKPKYPEKILQYNQSKETKMVYVDKNLIYIADGYNGLVILESIMQQGFPREHEPIDTQDPLEEEVSPVPDNISESTGGGIPSFPIESMVLGVSLGVLVLHIFQGNNPSLTSFFT
jgi:hypothetical protein